MNLPTALDSKLIPSEEVGTFWALVELMGHDQVAGQCRWLMAGHTCVLLEIQIPGNTTPLHRGVGSIFAVHICTEAEVMELVTWLRPPVSALDLALANARASRQPPPPSVPTNPLDEEDGIPF